MTEMGPHEYNNLSVVCFLYWSWVVLFFSRGMEFGRAGTVQDAFFMIQLGMHVDQAFRLIKPN